MVPLPCERDISANDSHEKNEVSMAYGVYHSCEAAYSVYASAMRAFSQRLGLKSVDGQHDDAACTQPPSERRQATSVHVCNKSVLLVNA